MTHQEFDERLDEIMFIFAQEFVNNPSLDAKEKAKQAITSLIKELVAEAKPLYFASPDKSEYQDGFNTCISFYEQNLLKELGEK